MMSCPQGHSARKRKSRTQVCLIPKAECFPAGYQPLGMMRAVRAPVTLLYNDRCALLSPPGCEVLEGRVSVWPRFVPLAPGTVPDT